MKTIGLVGGTSWVSTVDYYRIINEQVNARLGGDEAAKIILYSVNFGEIKKYTQADDWDSVLKIISDTAMRVANAGADCLLLCANTMHHIAPQVQDHISIPLLHIADATAVAIKKKILDTVALLGTKYTMQLPFYKERLAQHSFSTIIPDDEAAQEVNKTIYEELGKGILLPQTKERYKMLIHELIGKGAEGIILGCTEIPLLIKQEDSPVPVFDTTYIHAMAAVDFALQ